MIKDVIDVCTKIKLLLGIYDCHMCVKDHYTPTSNSCKGCILNDGNQNLFEMAPKWQRRFDKLRLITTEVKNHQFEVGAIYHGREVISITKSGKWSRSDIIKYKEFGKIKEIQRNSLERYVIKHQQK